MVRTTWLAAGCLAALGAVAVGKVVKTTATPTTNMRPVDGAIVGAGPTQEPLVKADRLQITYVRQEAPTESASQLIEPVVPDVPNSVSPEETNIVSRHWHDPNATNSATAKSKKLGRTLTAKKGKSTADPRGGRAADHAKPGAQTKPCNRTAVGDFLRSFNLAPACDS
jgi:hypothetical protein